MSELFIWFNWYLLSDWSLFKLLYAFSIIGSDDFRFFADLLWVLWKNWTGWSQYKIIASRSYGEFDKREVDKRWKSAKRMHRKNLWGAPGKSSKLIFLQTYFSSASIYFAKSLRTLNLKNFQLHHHFMIFMNMRIQNRFAI